MRKAAQRWIDPAKMAIVLVGDEKQIGEGVRTMVGDYERRGTDGAPLKDGAAAKDGAPAKDGAAPSGGR